jgi:hypothetical protein
MSNTGLYSHWYENVRSIAELVDDALMELRSSDTQRKASERLGDILTKPAASAALIRQMLSVMLRDVNSQLSLAKLGQELTQGGRMEAAIDDLEVLADILERERASTIEQMRT